MSAQPGQCGCQQVTDTSGALTRQKDQHARSRPDQSGHALVEKIYCQLLVRGSEVNALWPAGCAGTVQCDNPADFILRHTKELQTLLTNIFCSGKGKTAKVVQAGQRRIGKALKPFPVKGAAVIRPLDGLAELTQLMTADLLPCESVSADAD